jgi:RHS repeat-associated protein
VDARGATGTVYAGYDGLDRQLWRNATNGPTGAYVAYAYDATANGNQGVGHLTGETFTGGPNNTLSGSYAYVYDARGQQTGDTLTVGGTAYPVGTSYDDASAVTGQTYPDGEVVTTGYTAEGWLASLSTQQGGTTTTLVSGAGYTGPGGAEHNLTGASLGRGTYAYAASYDALLRATDLKLTRTSDGVTLFEEARSFDGAGNITTETTTLPGGTDNQAFCYDEQDRLTWASSASGSVPCGGSNSAGTLTSAQYTQSFAYDTLGRLTSGPLGAYTYGDSAHVHAATAIGPSGAPTWTASYDAAGEMTCRAATGATTCAGTPTGAALTYDAEGMLVAWQNAPSSPTTTIGDLYDGQGDRVEQQGTANGSTTTTVYVGNLEEIATTGGTTTTTSYYYAGAARVALAVNGVFSSLASDGLGSATVALDASGTVQASQLYAPYGTGRYSSGTMPGSYGFTGQRADAATGLDDYGARSYDPAAGQFTSADTVLSGGGFDVWGLSRYAYVEGDPEARLDPSGHDWFSAVVNTVASAATAAPAALAVLDATTGIPSMINDVQTIFSGNASTMDKVLAGADLLINVAMDVSMVVGVGEGLRAAYVGAKIAGHIALDVGAHAAEHAGEHALEDAGAHAAEHEAEDLGEHAGEDAAGCAESFAPGTLVATASGARAIAALKVGDAVVAYDPKTGQATTKTVRATFVTHDTDLVDVTLRMTTTAAHDAAAPKRGAATSHDEVVHTTANHPWLTADHGWLPASFMRVGEPVVRTDGTTATVAAIRAVPGAAPMWDLTVADLHDFAVGAGQYVVHNCGGSGGAQKTHQTYTVTNGETGEAYSGRTSGYGTPDENIQRRFDAGHERTGDGWGDPVLDRSSPNSDAIRGREQGLIDYYRRQGIAADQINGISPRNGNYARYMDAALREFGPILDDPRLG